MWANNSKNLKRAQMRAAQAGGWRRRFASVFIPVLALALTLQPAAFAAPSPTQLSTAPMFLDVSVASNVLFVMDDSLSMMDPRLPVPLVPAGLDPQESLGGNVTTKNGLIVERVNQWIFRSSVFNPLFYNPAITYRPWNDNGRAGESGNFPNASTAKTDRANGFRQGLVRHDMRYRGPNYTAANKGSGSLPLIQSLPLSSLVGANPADPPAYLAAQRPANGGFTGTVDVHSTGPTGLGNNQDIFSSPLTWVTGSAASCKSTTLARSTAQPWKSRPSEAQPSANRGTANRSSKTRDSEARETALRESRDRPTDTRPIEDRPREIVTDANRGSQGRPSTNKLTETRDTKPREVKDKPSYNRDQESRGTQYRTEKPGGLCSQFTNWQTLSAPPDVTGIFCTDPIAGELGSRQIMVFSQTEPCKSDFKELNSSTCVRKCESNETESGLQCIQPCPETHPDAATGGKCAAPCPNTHPNAHTTDSSICMANCSPGYTVVTTNQLQCVGGCPSTHPTEITGLCYGGCPDTYPNINSSATTQCLANCGGATPNVSNKNNLKCVANCPSDKPTASGNICYGSCPSNAPSVDSTNPDRCLGDCPNNAPNPVTGSATQCVGNCSGRFGNLVGSLCYENCPDGYPTVNPNNSAQCMKNCPGTFPTPGSPNILTCLANCPSDYPSLLTDGKCYAGCTGSFPTQNSNNEKQCLANCTGSTPNVNTSNNLLCVGNCPEGSTLKDGACLGACLDKHPNIDTADPTRCLGACASGTTLTGSSCVGCPSGYTSILSNTQCCLTTDVVVSACPLYLPDDATCIGTDRYYVDMNGQAPANYFVFVPLALDRAPLVSELNDPANYLMMEINRDTNTQRPRYRATFDKPWKNNDPTQGRAERADCGSGTTCTWEQEAQNFANWYTYYRTRLFSAIAVTAQALSGLTAESGLDSLRLGYGSLNFFPEGANPYGSFNPLRKISNIGRLTDTFTLDGQSSVGTLVRGVRPFTQNLPPSDPLKATTDSRQEVFDWLFSIRAAGATPTREAIDALGRYLTRTDDRGPWIDDRATTAATWKTSEDAATHIACRRNYAIVITDGEWTKVPIVTPPQQPRLESRTSTGLPSAFVDSQGYVPTTAVGVDGPAHTGAGPALGRTYKYVPADEVQISTVPSSPTGTLSDAALFWWSRDLRPDLANNVEPIDSPPERKNEAFWQSMTPYLVGYGISASRNTVATRTAVANRQAVTWPPINTGETVITDDDAACTAFGAGEPASGCGRRNDVLRAALAGRGDFLSATDVDGLARQVSQVFSVISEQEGSGSGAVGTSSVLTTDDRIFLARFTSKRWTGDMLAYDGVSLFDAAAAGLPAPTPLWHANFPAFATRNLLTSTDKTASGAQFVALGSLSSDQQAAIGSQEVLDYLRGDQSKEINQLGGTYRRRLSLLGDIVNSIPLYSKDRDFLYSAVRSPAAAGDGGAAYPGYLTSKASRQAALYVGANDGMLHAFNADNGTELFGYVPRAVYGQLSLLKQTEYDHRYFVDGPVVDSDVYLGSAWKTVLVGTTGAGGAWSTGASRLGGSIFALDITTPESMSVSQVLWDLTGADHEDIGFINQAGVIGSAKDGNWYYFVGNGYESVNDKARLLAINISTGAVLSLATDDAGGPIPKDSDYTKRPNGLGGVTPVYDSDRNIVAIYAGDKLGRVWKFDLSTATTASTLGSVAGVKLFEATYGGGTGAARQPITAAPRLLDHPLGGRYVVVGTGSFFERGDRTDLSAQSVYVLWEKNPDAPVEIPRTGLRQLTLGSDGQTADVDGLCLQAGEDRSARVISGQGSINLTTDQGVFFDLVAGDTTGERVLSSPIADGRFINITTYEPEAGGDPCKGGGRSYFYRLDLSFSRAGFVNKDKTCVGFSFLSEAATVAPTTLFGKESSPPSAVTTTRVLKKEGLDQMLKTLSRHRVGGPCIGISQSTGAGSIGSPRCSSDERSFRVWRELPRE
jgi:type IV pilus assembly protein PilY1